MIGSPEPRHVAVTCRTVHLVAGSSMTAFARAWRVASVVLWAGSCGRSTPDDGRPRRRWFSNPLVLAVVGVVASAVTLVQLWQWNVPAVLAAGLAVLQTWPVLLVVWWPLWAWRLVTAGLTVSTFLGYGQGALGWPWPATSVLVLVLVLYTVASMCRRELTAAAGVVTGVFVVVPALFTVLLPAGVIGGTLLGIATPLLLGDSVRVRRLAAAALRREHARTAVLEERARIARELHDIAGHGLSTIALQAEAAPHRSPDLPAAAADTFRTIRATARESLAELGRLVGVLRDEGDPADRAPQPGLGRLDALIAEMRRVGVAVRADIAGAPRAIPPGVDVSAYRIVQEAVRNAARHSAGAHVTIEIAYEPEALQVRVCNSRPTAPSPRTDGTAGSGHGLVGIRERVAMLGGRVDVGPSDDGGFVVEACLPLDRPEAT